MTVNATDLGPLQILIGTWQGNQGDDKSPEPDGTELNAYRETLTFKPVRPFSNAEEQRLIAVQYHQVVHRIRDNKQIHDQCGYIHWDEQNQELVQTATIPRGLSLVAGGNYTNNGDTHEFRVKSEVNSQWPISQSPFLSEKAKTLSYEQVLIANGDSLNYQQTTVVDIYGKVFNHTDENRLVRLA